MSDSEPANNVKYARRVYDQTFEWYKNADTRAQIILTLDGVFLVFITSSIFVEQRDLVAILNNFSPLTWVFLILMAIALILSIILAIACLWSRISSFDKKKGSKDNEIDPKDVETYSPAVTFFFQYISWLDRSRYQEYMMLADSELEVNALAAGIFDLSGNVVKKHQLVNWSFFFTGASLILFFFMGFSYIVGLNIE